MPLGFPALVVSYLIWTQAFSSEFAQDALATHHSAGTWSGIQKGGRIVPPSSPALLPWLFKLSLLRTTLPAARGAGTAHPILPAERKWVERGCWDDRSAESPSFTPLCFLARQKSWLGAWESKLLHEKKILKKGERKKWAWSNWLL